MKKFLLAMIMFSLSFTAQTHRFIYEYHFKTDSTAAEKRKVSMVLDVNPGDVKFYNYDFVVTDSINKTRGENSIVWDDTPALIRKKNSTINSNYIMVQNMFLIETDDKMSWNLENETKMIGGYKVQKATTKYGGRSWTAWFTKDINLSEGPYKFKGLPGLIFEIYDDKDNFKFSLVKSYKLPKTYETLEILEKFGGQNPVKIPESRLKKMMLDYYNDPLHTFKEHYKSNTNPDARFMVMGIEVKSPEQFKELSEMMQKNIKKNNNPIEINKAIRYN
ncbi:MULTISPECIES: GLPGLI family protein [Chryseobacterium]|uniref:GLPGLI family protein n=1 Tax=Chryseobacterium TaxID=59732 RepID=UPI0004931FEB|nr:MULTISPECIES: GLPGLI family protein [Chryseobacterium]MDR6159023.1 GLPGLI family protein [Chryseobacterium sp. SLBN-27]